MSKRKVRTYDKEFKLNAVKLCSNSGRSLQQIGKELGVPIATLAGWVSAHKEKGVQAFPGKGHLKPENSEVAELRKELNIIREERDILKKALGIFSSLRK